MPTGTFPVPCRPRTQSGLDTTAWHVIFTKPRQEDLARENLERQGYGCYLPRLRVEKVRRRRAALVVEPMFPRYLFVRLDYSDNGPGWAPIRSTLGVQNLVCFGDRPARADDALIDWLRAQEQDRAIENLFDPGDAVAIMDGPFAGIEAIYQTADADRRAIILLEILRKPVPMHIEFARLRKTGQSNQHPAGKPGSGQGQTDQGRPIANATRTP